MRTILSLVFAITSFAGYAAQGHAAPTELKVNNFFDFKLQGIDGKPVEMKAYKGKTLLVVNTASRCGYTPQYKSLQELYDRYKDKGLVVMGLPANDFGGQEPGSNAEIKDFCERKFNVKFPMFEKSVATGGAKAPVFKFLTTQPGKSGEIEWNFEKFLINSKGELVERFPSKVEPLDGTLTSAIEKSLSH